MKTTWFSKLPSRLPPDFVQRTLARLLPAREEIAKFSRAELLILLQRKRELTKLIEDDPVRFFVPAETGGQAGFMTNADPEIQCRFMFAANKTGKTTGGAIVAGEIGEGHPLWGGAGRGASPWLTACPKKMCFFSEDFSTHEETIVPTYASWMRRYLCDVIKGPSGNLSRVLHKNGTQIYLRTYDQGYEKAEGKDYDLVWCDEPPPRDIYTAIFRGLVATKGLLLITATLLSETWLYDEMQQPFVRIYEATMFDNQWLSDQARRNFAAMLTEEERAIRIYGKPSTLSGAIYPQFKDDAPYVVLEDSGPPWNPVSDKPWPVIMAVDPHERKPVYVAWAYVTPENGLLWFDYDLVPSDSIHAVLSRLEETRVEAPRENLSRYYGPQPRASSPDRRQILGDDILASRRFAKSASANIAPGLFSSATTTFNMVTLLSAKC